MSESTMSTPVTVPNISWSDYDHSRWFTPVTSFQYWKAYQGDSTDPLNPNGLSMLAYINPKNWMNDPAKDVPLSVKLPNILIAIIVIGLILVAAIGAFFGCWVGDIVFPTTNPLIFTGETLLMSLGMALMCSVLFFFTRKTAHGRESHPLWSAASLQELALLTGKFGMLHLIFQFTGFYSWAFPDSAMGGALTTSWGDSCPNGETGTVMGDWSCRGLNNLNKEKGRGAYKALHDIVEKRTTGGFVWL